MGVLLLLVAVKGLLGFSVFKFSGFSGLQGCSLFVAVSCAFGVCVSEGLMVLGD